MDFDGIMSRITELAQSGVAKAKELGDIAKLKMSNTSEEDAIRKAYTEIGRLYFAERGMAPEAPYAALCGRVATSREKIAYNNEKIADIKAAANFSDADIASVVTEVASEEPTIIPEDDQL